MIALGHPLAPLLAYRQWIPVRLVPLANLKTDKLPIDHRSGEPSNAHDPAIWLDYATALQYAQQRPGYTVGFVLTAADPWFCLDIDSCLQPDNTWSPVAVAFCQALPNTVVEVSQSGRGLHLWGQGAVPLHRKKRTDLGLELYTERRFIAIGSHAQGDMTQPCPTIAKIAADYFPPDPAGVEVPDEGPCAEWSGPADDDELLSLARRYRSAAAVFGDGVRFSDLFDANVEALARRWPASGRADGLPYDASSVDASLAQRLAYLTGRDPARIDRIMRRSPLARPKWERDDYMARTIRGACGRQQQVLQDKPSAQAATASLRSIYIGKDTPLETALTLVRHCYTREGRPCLKSWQDAFYLWTGAAWREATAADIKSRIYGFIHEHGYSPFRPNQSNVSNVLDALKHAPGVHLDSAFIAPGWLHSDAVVPTSEIVACANGLLHLPSRALLPATPDLFNMNAVPYRYESHALAPAAWLRFLADVWPQDPEAIATLQEMFGYLLTPDTSQQKIFMLIGPKRSGKGTIARVLTELLGADNVAGPTLSSLSDSFGKAPLLGKLAAVIADARLSGRVDQKEVAEQLLSISGEDRVDVNRKFQKQISVRLGVRFVMLTNEIPRIADASGAMASRFIILKMWESFLGREDPGLTSRLLQELPGILNWAVEGWHRLKARGHFVQPQSAAEAVQELADLGSPIGAFVRDECATGPSATVKVDDLYRAWSTWCVLQGNPHAGTKQVFGRDLTALLPSITVKRARDGADRERWYVGIGLRGPQWSAVPPIAPSTHTTSPHISTPQITASDLCSAMDRGPSRTKATDSA